MWSRVFMSCSRDGVFKGVKNMFEMTADQLDAYCEAEGVVWEELPENEIHIHGCDINCYCHGGLDNIMLRPRPLT